MGAVLELEEVLPGYGEAVSPLQDRLEAAKLRAVQQLRDGDRIPLLVADLIGHREVYRSADTFNN